MTTAVRLKVPGRSLCRQPDDPTECAVHLPMGPASRNRPIFRGHMAASMPLNSKLAISRGQNQEAQSAAYRGGARVTSETPIAQFDQVERAHARWPQEHGPP